MLSSSGYELVLYDRAGENSAFCHLKPPYTPRKIKEVAGQCKIYIKPLQKDLIEDTEELPSQIVEIEDSGPVIGCITCGAVIPMSNMKDHHASFHSDQPKTKKTRNKKPRIDTLLQNQTEGEHSRTSERKSALLDLIPTATDDEVESALTEAYGDVDGAAQQLLGLDKEHDIFSVDSSGTEAENVSEKIMVSSLDEFRERMINRSIPRQRFDVCREDGMEELKKDIFSCYKNNQCSLYAVPRVRFEGEEGLGSCPVREFFLCAMKIVQEGIGNRGKPIMFFEGEADHKIPIHDQSLRCTGSFRAIGRIIGHSVLHGGPLLYELSPAIKHYWASTESAAENDEDLTLQTLPITLEDIPDIELRGCISQLQSLPANESPSAELRELIQPYLFEAGIDIDLMASDLKLVIQGLIVYQVIDKRKRELDDIAKGMDEVNLHSFLRSSTADIVETIFPNSGKRYITADEMKEAVVFEETEGNEQIIAFFFLYMSYLAKYESEQPSLTDLCCFWTATNILPPTNTSLLVKFDDGTSELPFAETCFCSLTLPTMHQCYEEFKKAMDTALRYGALGIDHA